MAKFTYQGPNDEFVFRGITFVKGKPFVTDDADLATKLSCMVEFGGKSSPDPVEAKGENADVTALNAENASLRETVARLNAALEDAEARCTALEAELAAYENGETPQEDAEPKAESTDWRDLHWKQRVKMAQDLGAEASDVGEADAFLQEHFG